MSDQPAYVPAQGDIIWVDLDSRTGREQSDHRPALVLSQKEFCAVTGYAFVAPVTSRVRGWPFEVALPQGALVEGVVLVDQSRSIDIAARHVRYACDSSEAVLTEALAKLQAILSTGRRT